ncbi:MAG: GGDEF domain-containing protein [Limnochordales bacterium]|nr:GGDEF domain-containing protein [Limnochordales bacterium]
MWRREAAYGFAVGAAVGGGLLSLGWLVGAATHWDVERWLPVAYVGLLAAAGAYGGSRWAALQQLAVTDPLTGLFNRRYFNSVLVKECARARRTGAPVSVLILDVDNFKLINDLMGHEEGDRVLCRLAAAIQGACRGADVVARWGGEEFAVILPGTDAGGAQRAARRIAGQAAEAAGVALSVGWATFPEEGERALMARADQRMYDHKRTKCGAGCVRHPQRAESLARVDKSRGQAQEGSWRE